MCASDRGPTSAATGHETARERGRDKSAPWGDAQGWNEGVGSRSARPHAAWRAGGTIRGGALASGAMGATIT